MRARCLFDSISCCLCDHFIALDSLEKSQETSSVSISEALQRNTKYSYPKNKYLSRAVQYLAGNEGYSGFGDNHSSYGGRDQILKLKVKLFYQTQT